jgi:oligoribonuclease
MDMEMSGLEAETDRILEVAVLVTDGELEVVAEGPNLVLHQAEEVLEAMDEWNTTHHGQSGLTKRVRESTIDEAQASAALLAFLAEHTQKKKAPLAGNSIHQDRRFVARYLPEVEDWLHYRNVDVSTVKELAKRWYPKQYSGRPTKKGSHRAMDDLAESIEELKYYRKALFLPSES